MRMGSGFVGSIEQEVSLANKEIIPEGRTLYKLSFVNPKHDCTILINNEFSLYIPMGMGFEVSESDQLIHSFKILEDGVSYVWIGGIYK